MPKAVEAHGGAGVVVCSLTKAAAREIASRDIPIPDENVGTLHSLCYRAVAARTGSKLEIADKKLDEWNEEVPPAWRISDSSQEIGLDGRPPKTDGDGFMQRAGIYRHRMTPTDQWDDDVLTWQLAWEEWCEERDYYDFTGLIETCQKNDLPCPIDPQVLIVDEAQDSTRLEINLLRRWAERANAEALVLAGDSDQCIYGFRGADPRDFAGINLPEENHYKLVQSYRVPAEVHAYATSWIKKAAWRYPVAYLPTKEQGRLRLDDHISYRAPWNLCDEIEARAAEDSEHHNRVMVLATCGYMLKPIIRELKIRGVPFHNPYKAENGAWSPLRGGGDRLWTFLRAHPRLGGSSWTYAALWRWGECMEANGTFAPGMKTVLQKNASEFADQHVPMQEALALLDDTARAELLAAWDSVVPREAIAWFARRVLDSKTRLFEYAFNVAERDPRALSVTPRIILGTVHSVKGGEADHVFLSPDISMQAAERWGSGDENHDQTVRTIYVGVTRARKTVSLCGRSAFESVDWQ